MFQVITGQEIGKVLFCSEKRFRRKKIETIKNKGTRVKPEGGLWTSPFNEKEGSEWIHWCNSEHFAIYKKGYILKPKKNSKFAVIDSLDDLITMLERYEYSYIKETNYPELYRGKLDFEKLMKDGYDGIYLTSEGQWATRLTTPSLYGWDCETVFWFKPKLKKLRRIRVKKWSEYVNYDD